MRILFGGTKGGVGKTNLACQVSAYLAQAGRDVILIDADSSQLSAQYWARLREKVHGSEVPRVGFSIQKGSLAGAIQDFASRYDDVIIDCGGHDSLELRTAIPACDVLYAPANLAMVEMRPLEALSQRISQMRQGPNRLRAALALRSKIETNRSAYVQERTAILRRLCSEEGLWDGVEERTVSAPELRLSDACFYFRAASFGRAWEQGLGLVEMEGRDYDPKACAELEVLMNELRSLEEGPNAQVA